VETRAEDIRLLKMPYSTPRLIPHSVSGLAARTGERSAEDGWPVENRPWWLGSPPPLIVEGFEGEVGDLVQVLSSIGLRSDGSSKPAAKTREAIPENRVGPVENGICILLVDMRRRFSGSRRPLTRIEIGSDSSVILTLILTDSGEDFMAGGEISRTDLWHFRGSIVTDGLGVLIKSVFQIWSHELKRHRDQAQR